MFEGEQNGIDMFLPLFKVGLYNVSFHAIKLRHFVYQYHLILLILLRLGTIHILRNPL